MGVPDHRTCLLWNLYAGQEAAVRILHGKLTGSKLGKEYVKPPCYPAYLTNKQNTSCEMPRWNKNWNQDCWEKYQQPQICIRYHSNGKNWRGTKEALDEDISSSLQFSHSVVSNSLWFHGLQHSRLPCPSQLPELAQTYVHQICDAIQPSHPLSSYSPPAFSLSQHQGLFQWISSWL